MTIFWNNIKRIFGRKVNVVFMIVIPVILNAFIVSAYTSDSKYTIGIRDQDQSQFTKELENQLQDICDIKMLKEQDNIKQMVIDSKVDIAVVFDKDFTEKVIQGEDVQAQIYALDDTNASDSGQMFLRSCIAASKEIGKASGGEEQAFYDGMKDYYNKDYKVEYEKFATSISEKVDMADQSLGYIAFGMVFLMTFATMLILEDKLNGVYDRVCITPLPRASYFVQNLLSFFVVAVIQVVLLLFILTKFLNLSYGQTASDVLQTGFTALAFALVCIAIGITASRFAKTTLMASSVIMLINLPMLMLGGCLWPRSIMPDMVQKIGNFMPSTWFLKAASETMYGKGILSVWQYVAGMILLAGVLLTISFTIKTEKAK